ncbi:MAG: NAD-binding protein [Methanobacteriota archaeon]
MYIVVGCGSVGFATAKLLLDRGKEVLILDRDKKRVQDLRDAEFQAIAADSSDLPRYKDEFERASGVLLLAPDVDANLAALKFLKSEIPRVFVLARAPDPVAAEALEQGGADHTLLPAEVLSRSILRLIQDYEAHRAGDELTEIIKGARSIGIFLQSNPDPDALASGLALTRICRELGVPATTYYGGAIGHQENRAFVNLLDLELVQVGKKDDVMDLVQRHDKIALIECSIPGKNNVLPRNVIPNIVFDHHQVAEEDVVADFADVRPALGATSTILTKYVQQLGIPVDAMLAVALLYGIRTDTRTFTRGVTAEDMAAATFLSAYADMELLEKIESPPMSSETLDVLGRAIRNREVYGSFLVSCVEFINDRDILPQAADFLLNLEGVSTVLVFGIVEDTIHMSARSRDVRVNLGEALEKAFGKQQAGGHATMAGGQIKLGIFGNIEHPDALVQLARDAVRRQFFQALGIEEKRKA